MFIFPLIIYVKQKPNPSQIQVCCSVTNNVLWPPFSSPERDFSLQASIKHQVIFLPVAFSKLWFYLCVWSLLTNQWRNERFIGVIKYITLCVFLKLLWYCMGYWVMSTHPVWQQAWQQVSPSVRRSIKDSSTTSGKPGHKPRPGAQPGFSLTDRSTQRERETAKTPTFSHAR